MATYPGTCPLDCPDACGLLIETDGAGQLRRLRGDPDHPYTRGFLCGKTARFHELVHSGARLTTPLVRRGGSLEPASWDEAVGAIADRVERTDGEQILPLFYAGNQGLVARKFPLRMMHALGAGRMCGSICSSVGDAGYRLVLGDGIGPDVEEAARAVCSLAAVLGHADRVLSECSDHFGLATGQIDRPELRGNRPLPTPSEHAALGQELVGGRYEMAFVWGHNPAVTLPDSSRVCPWSSSRWCDGGAVHRKAVAKHADGCWTAGARSCRRAAFRNDLAFQGRAWDTAHRLR